MRCSTIASCSDEGGSAFASVQMKKSLDVIRYRIIPRCGPYIEKVFNIMKV